MASRYPTYSDYETKDGVITVSPSWCLLVVRFKNIITMKRSSLGAPTGIPYRDDGGNMTATDISPEASIITKQPLIIASDCIQLTTQTTKSSHVSSLSATLLGSSVNYGAEIMPGDWVVAWMANSQEKIANVIERLKILKEPCNEFNDGLKFIGRVQSIRKSGQIERGSGVMRTRYYLQAMGFKELDTSIFFEPYLQRKYADIGAWLGALQKITSDFIVQDQGISIMKAIPQLVNVLLGEGLPTSISRPALEESLPEPLYPLHLSDGLDAPYAYVIPKEIPAILGVTVAAKKNGIPCYADILQLIIGRQRYTTEHSPGSTKGMFSPDGLTGGTNHKTCGSDLSGSFLPQIPQFSNKPIWNILEQFLNPAINEMYTCLRVDSSNKIMPTMIVRQLPFTSPHLLQYRDDVTPFHELPRWFIDPNMVYSYEIGRSNSMRFNFIHVYGQASLAQDNDMVRTEAIIRAPPIRDNLDIQRNGLHGDFMEVACDLKTQLYDPGTWMRIRADFQMGLHLSLNGTIRMQGIQSPICEGDNLEFDGVVYHIESITHSCATDFSGRRSFETLATLTHGMNVDVDLEDDASLFPNVSSSNQVSNNTLTDLDPGITHEALDATKAPKEEN